MLFLFQEIFPTISMWGHASRPGFRPWRVEPAPERSEEVPLGYVHVRLEVDEAMFLLTSAAYWG